MKYRMSKAVFLAVPAVWLLMAATSILKAEASVADFYSKKGLRMIVGSGAGGGYDTYARAFARHYEKHLPGKPNIVVQNMPGASGIVATNWVYHQADRDGSVVLATSPSLINSNLLGNKNVKFDVQNFNWLGSISKADNLCVTWHTSPVKNIKQLIGKEANVSATGRRGNSAIVPLLLNQTMGTKFKVIAGYSATASRLALESGEVDAICGPGLSTLQASNPDWFINKKINVIAQIGLERHPELPDVHNVIELVNDQDKPVYEFFGVTQEMGRPYTAPPAIPADRLASLRASFMATVKDKDFLQDMKKLHLSVDPLSGKQMEELVDRLYGYPQSVLNRVAQLLGVAHEERIEACAKIAKDPSQCH